MTLASSVIDSLRSKSETIAVAESLTGGLLTAELVAVAGASQVLQAGIVAYTAAMKTELLGIDTGLIETHGTVNSDVARAMARNVARQCVATYGLATTGVSGPGPAEGKSAGTVFIAIAGPDRVDYRRLELPGDRRAVADGTVAAILSWLVDRLAE